MNWSRVNPRYNRVPASRYYDASDRNEDEKAGSVSSPSRKGNRWLIIRCSNMSKEQKNGASFYLSKDLILELKSSSRSDVGLLSGVGHVETDTSLTLSLVQNKIHHVQGQHILVDLGGELLSDLRQRWQTRACMSNVVHICTRGVCCSLHTLDSFHFAIFPTTVPHC